VRRSPLQRLRPATAAAGARPLRDAAHRLPLMKLRSPSMCCWGARYHRIGLVNPSSHSAPGFAPSGEGAVPRGISGFLARGAPVYEMPLRSILGVASPAESCRHQAAALSLVACLRGASHEVCGSYSTCRRRSPLATRRRRSDDAKPPGVASPGSFRPQGFDPPDGLLLRSACPPYFRRERSWSS
jgi:hypothetical protein